MREASIEKMGAILMLFQIKEVWYPPISDTTLLISVCPCFLIKANPVTTREGKKLSLAFSWIGLLKIFEEKGFKVVQRLVPEKPLVRLKITETN